MTFRYIGSKARLVNQIAEHIGVWKQGIFIDVFCGMGSVAEIAAELGWPVRLNDQLLSATTMAAARLIPESRDFFKKLGGYENALAQLNSSTPVKGFIWREYSPASLNRTGVERRYFTEDNAAKIDGVRAKIREWGHSGRISRRENMLLIADLLSATNRVASTTHQNKTRPKTYPRSPGRIYYGRVRSTEGAVMRRHASGIGCGARGQETNAPPAPGRRRGSARGHYDPLRGAR